MQSQREIQCNRDELVFTWKPSDGSEMVEYVNDLNLQQDQSENEFDVLQSFAPKNVHRYMRLATKKTFNATKKPSASNIGIGSILQQN